ncbi:MAG: phosphoribosyltransferase regulatory subunit [Solirubrobacterales bacterium]|jgi:ATP phosphoribosyltransferase regulatory subunit|nr:phosphoribosyltransferase regulatory subunit [Solirubrobacterales bacterium]
MIHPIPSGTRDVLPDEMRELRAIEDALRATFDAAGYGEVATPALEYESVLARGESMPPAYRVADDHGNVLALRTDMTVPIARVASTRYASAEPPLRFCYVANAYRQVRPHRGQMREFLQAGVELIGSPAPQGTAEVLGVLSAALESVGLKDFRIGLGSASIVPALLDQAGVGAEDREKILYELVTRDFVGLEREVKRLGLDERIAHVPLLRGGPEVLDQLPDGARGLLGDVLQMLTDDVRDRVILDLGLARDLGYYTGAIFEVYAPGIGSPLGGGGRYDELLGRFGRPLPAVGFALTIDRLHEALAR